jgi:hypothetical protein
MKAGPPSAFVDNILKLNFKVAGTIFVFAIWLAAAFWGMRLAARYESTPGEAASVSKSWPTSCDLSRTVDKQTVLLFLHPHCGCSRATVQEFSQALTRYFRTSNLANLDIHCVFVVPAAHDFVWTDTSLIHRAREISGAKIDFDVGGRLAKQFHVRTSGHTLLYDTNGNLLYSGGVTIARGHEGNNTNRAAFENALSKSTANLGECPVFGCSLLDSPNEQTGSIQ